MGNCCNSEPDKTELPPQYTTHKKPENQEKNRNIFNQEKTPLKKKEPIDKYHKTNEIDTKQILNEEQVERKSNSPDSEFKSQFTYSRLKGQQHFYNVFQPSISNDSRIARLQQEEPSESFFQGLPRFSKITQSSMRNERNEKTRPGTDVQIVKKHQLVTSSQA